LLQLDICRLAATLQVDNKFIWLVHSLQTLFIVWLIWPWKAVSSIILSLYAWIFNRQWRCLDFKSK
jgi:hypothetical protein